MHVDRHAFERSFLYLGPGYDIQPLLRFTHLCDTFLYPNLYLDRGPVEEWYDAAFTGDEENESQGAADVAAWLRGEGREDWMHSPAGVRVRADLLRPYGEALVSLVSHLADLLDLKEGAS